MNKIAQHFKDYMDIKTLRKIYLTVQLDYEIVVSLKDIILNNVFKNRKFIKACLETSYFDPISVFTKKFFNSLENMQDSINREVTYKNLIEYEDSPEHIKGGYVTNLDNCIYYCLENTKEFLKDYDKVGFKYPQSQDCFFSTERIIEKKEETFDNIINNKFVFDYFSHDMAIIDDYVNNKLSGEISDYMTFLFLQAQKLMPDSVFKKK